MNLISRVSTMTKSKKTIKKKTLTEGERAVRSINRDLKKATKVLPPQHKGPTRSVLRGIQARIHPESALGSWTRSLARPFEVSGVFCPVNYNPAPSFIQSTARTTSTNLNLLVTANTTTSILLWPGHAPPPTHASSSVGAGDSLDAVSYHANDVFVGAQTPATTYVVGPMNKHDNVGDKTAIIGVVTTGSTFGNTTGNIAGGTSTIMPWDVPLPYTTNSVLSGGGGHSRWQLVSMGVRIHNMTPELYRGGSVISVQPNNSMTVSSLSVSQSTFTNYPTFHDWGVGDGKGVEISWIPRAQDLAFWHGFEAVATGGYPDADMQGPAIMIFLNAPSGASAQVYTYEVVCNWQLAGTYLNAVGGPAAHYPELKPTVEKTVSVMLNTSPSATHAPRVAEAVSSDSGTASAWSAKDWAFEKFSEGASHLASAAVRAAGAAAVRHVQMPHQRIR